MHIRLDPNSQISESDESNNDIETVLDVPVIVGLPDLTFIGGIQATANVVSPMQYNLMTTVSNQGTAPASTEIRYIAAADGREAKDPRNTCNDYTILQPGTTCLFARTLTFSTAGSKTIQLKVDWGKVFAESDETNNTAETILTVPAPTGV